MRTDIHKIGGTGMSYCCHEDVKKPIKIISEVNKSFKKIEQMLKFTEKSDKAFFRGLKH